MAAFCQTHSLSKANRSGDSSFVEAGFDRANNVCLERRSGFNNIVCQVSFFEYGGMFHTDRISVVAGDSKCLIFCMVLTVEG